MAGRKRLKGALPPAAEKVETAKLLAVVVDKALRDFSYFLKFVSTVDEAETDPRARIKRVPYQEPFVRHIAKVLQAEPIVWVPKSRRMMLTWINAAKLVWSALSAPHYHGFVQSLKDDKADWFVRERCYFIWQYLPDWFKVIALKGKPSARYSFCRLEFSNNSKIWGVPQGADQFRGFTASEVFIDEASAQPLFRESLTAILPLREKGCRIVMVATAMPSYFGEVVQGPVKGDYKNKLRGVKEWRLQNGGYVLQVHYSADPKKDPENPLGRAWVERIMEEYPGGMDSPEWRQEMEIDFSAYRGTKVYPDWSDELYPSGHLVKPFEVPDDVPKWRSVDYGRRNPTACLWFFEYDDEYFVYKEFYQNKTTLYEIKSTIYEMSRPDLWSYKFTVIDPSTDAITMEDVPTIMYMLNEEPFGLTALKGDRDAAGREFLQELLRTKRLKVFDNLTNFRREINGYRFEDYADAKTADKHNLKETPIKKDDHAMDALKMWANGIRWKSVRPFVPNSPLIEPSYTRDFRSWMAQRETASRYIGRKGIFTT